MAITEHASGTQSATINTTHTLNPTNPDSTDGVYQLVVDCNALAAGDALELSILESALSGGTQRLAHRATLHGVQSEPLYVSPPITLMHGWSMTLRQTAGTGRSFPWSIRKAG